MWNILGALFSGLIVGALARFFYPGAVEMGWVMTSLLGVGGSLLAGLVIAASSAGGINGGVNRAGCLASIIGAIILIFLGRTFL